MDSSAERIVALLSRGALPDAVAKLKTERDPTVEDMFAGACAMVLKTDWLTADRLTELRWADILLESVSQRIGDTPQCALMRAFALYQLGEYKQAIARLKKASKAGSDFSLCREELIALCRKAMKRPGSTDPFPARVQRAWAAFAREEAELRRLLREADGRPVREKRVLDRIHQLVGMALPHAGCAVAWGDRPVLELHPDTLKSAALQLKYFADHAPRAVSDHWEIRVGIAPPTEQALQQMRQQGGDFSGMEVQIVPLSGGQPGDLYKLIAYHPRLGPAPVTQDLRNEAMDWILRRLGTLPYLNAFLTVDFRGTPPRGHTAPLEQLLPALEARGWGDRRDSTALLHRRHTYRRDPVPLGQSKERRWRTDIVQATSLDPALDLHYIAGTTEACTERYFAGSGAVPGFVVFPLQGQTGNPRALLEALLQALDTAMDPETAVVLGDAEGLHFGYLDLLAWDLRPALVSVERLLRRRGIPWACWHSFYALDRTVQFL